MSDTKQPYLEFRHIGKKFGVVRALSDISFACKEGTIHALMGENGAGKSTLLKILAGNYQPSEGEMRINGEPVRFQNTSDALNSGIAIIYQELNLLLESSVAENIYIGQLPVKNGLIDTKTLYANTEKQLKRLGLNDIDPKALLKTLPIGQRQMIEIAKALTREAKIIAFDEPTSSLSSREITKLFEVIKELRSEGRVIIYVSHRMEEIFQISDCITVFKDGQYVQTFNDVKSVSHDDLVRAMVGRNVGDVYGYTPRSHGKVRLEIKELLAPGVKSKINLSVKSGEIVGLFGLVGAGRSELMKAVYGATQVIHGQVLIDGKPVNIKSPSDAISNGLVFCPEDRKADGIIAIHSVRDNINISARRKTLSLGCLINSDWEKQNAQVGIKNLNIKTPTDETVLMNLSGGNQQKVILGRWLSEEIKCILLDEPTRGIDVGAKNEIYNIIYKIAREGKAVIVVSSDLPEILGISDRVVVMRDGAITGELMHDDATEEKALRLAMVRSEKEVA